MVNIEMKKKILRKNIDRWCTLDSEKYICLWFNGQSSQIGLWNPVDRQ